MDSVARLRSKRLTTSANSRPVSRQSIVWPQAASSRQLDCNLPSDTLSTVSTALRCRLLNVVMSALGGQRWPGVERLIRGIICKPSASHGATHRDANIPCRYVTCQGWLWHWPGL
jgi:hypothetical protein